MHSKQPTRESVVDMGSMSRRLRAHVIYITASHAITASQTLCNHLAALQSRAITHHAIAALHCLTSRLLAAQTHS